MKEALILAGGMGTRLGQRIGGLPKSMAEINGRPFLEYLILQLKVFAFSNIILLVGHKKEIIKEYFEDGRRWGVRIQYSEEDAPLGTGGALKLARRIVHTPDMIVMNGDSFVDANFAEFFDFHMKKRAFFTMLLVAHPNEKRYGSVEIDADGRLKNFREKGDSGSGKLANAGVYVINQGFFDIIPSGKAVSLETEVLPFCLEQKCFGFTTSSCFVDIGTPDSYDKLVKNPSILDHLAKNMKRGR